MPYSQVFNVCDGKLTCRLEGNLSRVLIFAVFVGEIETAKIATTKIIYLEGVALFQGRSSKFKMRKTSKSRNRENCHPRKFFAIHVRCLHARHLITNLVT